MAKLSISDFFDSYDLKARWCPALIVLLPAFITIFGCFPTVTSSPALTISSGTTSLALAYFAAMLVRELGARSQVQLWEEWGGPPSTRFLRFRDGRLSEALKGRIRQQIYEQFQIRLGSRELEGTNPQAADQAIEQAFKRVREFLRGNDKASLVDKHNAEYGFARNLYGSRWVLVILASVGLLAAGFTTGGKWTPNAVAGIDFFVLATWIPVGFQLIPTMLKRNAENYAEKAWLTFAELNNERMKLKYE